MLLPVTPSEPTVAPLLSPAEGWPFLEGAPQTPRSSQPSLQLLILRRVIIFQAPARSGGQRRRSLTHREERETGPTEGQDLPEQGGRIVTRLLSGNYLQPGFERSHCPGPELLGFDLNTEFTGLWLS